jgi:inner membrane protein
MDPLTHGLTGLALRRAGAGRWPRYATPILVLAAMAPDLDVLTSFRGWVAYLHYHRHLTHSFLGLPVMALLPVLLVRLFARKPFPWKAAYAASLAGVLTHLLMDGMNAYGVRWLLPFDGTWYHVDIASLRDVWMWAVLLLAALAPLLSRLVSAEIGAKSGSGRGLGVFALLFLLAFPAARWVLHERAVAELDARLYEGQTPTRVAALPTSFNPFAWRGLVETGSFYAVSQVNLLGEFDPAAARIFYKPEPSPPEAAAAAAARRTEAFRVFLDFSRYPMWRFRPVEGGIRVEAIDMRFGTPDAPAFMAHAVVSPDGRVLESGFRY